MTLTGWTDLNACAHTWSRNPIDRLSRLGTMTSELPIFRWINLMIFAAKGDEPLQKDQEEPLSFCRRCCKGIAHDPVRHFAAAFGKFRVTPDIRSELEAPVVLDRSRHVDQIRP